MKILVAEDDNAISEAYKDALESRGHEVIVTRNGDECVRRYNEEADRGTSKKRRVTGTGFERSVKSPFDAIILDYKMPNKDGLEAAKEILERNPDQRIIFASAYVRDTLQDSIKQLKRVVELMQKPFGLEALIETVEDKDGYVGLKKIMANLREIKDLNPTEDQMKGLFEALRQIQKYRTY
jgi:CheY-like chemotaxis protein